MAAFAGFAELETNGWSNDAISSGYVNMFAPASDMAIPFIVSAIAEAGRVLDLCCGQGNVTEALTRAGHDVIGADFSAQMLSFARERLPRGTFVEADAQDLPFADSEFDVVVCSFGLMHVPDQPKALREVRRVLKSGGQFVMTSWCGPDVSPVFQVFYGSVQEHGSPAVQMPESPNFHQYANEELARTLLADAQLELVGCDQLECSWLLDRPEHLAEIFQKGAPRGGYLLSQQPEANRVAIKDAVARKVAERFAEGEAWRAPIPASLVIARAV
ncbi:methyltransferase domain-containing protein [Rhodobacterales bacterium HKCCE3408]|nr:methyltransferase domain-containing protein [Rhodobacterales bacterium HKCCE3408]